MREKSSEKVSRSLSRNMPSIVVLAMTTALFGVMVFVNYHVFKAPVDSSQINCALMVPEYLERQKELNETKFLNNEAREQAEEDFQNTPIAIKWHTCILQSMSAETSLNAQMNILTYLPVPFAIFSAALVLALLVRK